MVEMEVIHTHTHSLSITITIGAAMREKGEEFGLFVKEKKKKERKK